MTKDTQKKLDCYKSIIFSDFTKLSFKLLQDNNLHTLAQFVLIF